MGGNPLANLGDLTKPATVLIEKISDAIGGIFKPYQMVRVAKAEVAVEQIRAESQIQISDLTKPATVLIEKISDAIGGIFKPYQMVRVAKAEVAAEQIRAESQIQITDLHRRAMHRFLEEEAGKQSNIEEITNKALPLLKETSSPQDVEDDWITNFFDKCRIISDGEMQKLWSRVLASEANNPGAFAKRTVNLLADLDKSDAELFTRLCGFVWTVDHF